MNLSILITLTVSVAIALATTNCPSSQWIQNMDICYLVFPNDRFYTWSVGYRLCQENGGLPILPKSASENEFVKHTLEANVSSGDHVSKDDNPWLACNVDDGIHGCDDLSYTPWITTIVHMEDGETCVILALSQNGDWRKVPCAREKRVMCEFRPQTVENTSAGKSLDTQAVPTRDISEDQLRNISDEAKSFRPSKCPRSFKCSVVSLDGAHCLTDRIITEFAVKTSMQCCAACSADSACRSFNLKGRMCQLSDATFSEVGSEISQTMDNCIYYEFSVA